MHCIWPVPLSALCLKDPPADQSCCCFQQCAITVLAISPNRQHGCTGERSIHATDCSRQHVFDCRHPLCVRCALAMQLCTVSHHGPVELALTLSMGPTCCCFLLHLRAYGDGYGPEERLCLFLGMERLSVIFVYDITDPAHPVFQSWARPPQPDAANEATRLTAPEGITYAR